MPQPKDKDWLNGYKSKTPIYAVYKRPTSAFFIVQLSHPYMTTGKIIHITICKIDSQWEFAVCLRELKSVLHENLDGWEGVCVCVCMCVSELVSGV